MRKDKLFTTKKLVVAALLVALGTLTQIFPLFEMPMGGSVTLFSMLFISAIGWLCGPAVGALGGLAVGLMQLVSPYIVHPLQFLLEYVVAFVALGALAGFFKNLTAGYIAAVLVRYICHVLAGCIFFSEYAEGFVSWLNGAALVWAYSLAYNAAYILTEAAVTVTILALPAVRGVLCEAKARLLVDR